MPPAFSTLQIGYIVAEFGAPMTGSERYFFDLLRALAKADVPSTGLIVGEFNPSIADVPNLESFAAERGSNARERIANLRGAVRKLAPQVDVVAAHAPEHAWPILDLIREKPLVVHFHGPRTLEYIAERRSWRRVTVARIAETLTYARAARFIALSDANASVLGTYYHVPDEKIRVIPGAVDTVRFAPHVSKDEARARMGWPHDRPIVLAVRRLAATKGMTNLIDAIGLLKGAIPNVFLAVAGAGPLLDDLRARVVSLGLTGHVRFEGELSETLADAYRGADLSIVPSVELEGFGLSVVESLACGTPALVTPVVGLPETVRELDRRLVLGGSSAVEIARGLEDALSGKIPLPSEAACLAFVRRFAWATIGPRIRAAYQELL